jgi:hypothetical protein
LCHEIYGTDGSAVAVSDLVTARVTITTTWYEDRAGLFAGGRLVARAFDRDSGARLGDGVIILRGNATSGGSRKNWETRIQGGSIFEIRDLPRGMAGRLFNDLPSDAVIEVIEPTAHERLAMVGASGSVA